MEVRTYPKTGQAVSLLGFGGMRLPVVDGKTGSIDEVAATEMVDHALAQGINYFDTAYGYHEGNSEAFFGRALVARHPRDRFFLASKLPPWYLSDPGDVERIFEEQLSRCQTDYFDFYLLHNMNAANLETFEKVDAYNQMREKQRQGKIRHLGFSFHAGPDLIQTLVDRYEWDFGQIQLNYLDWLEQEAKEQYEILTARGIPVIVMEPVRGGTLVTLTEKSAGVLKQANPAVSTASWAIRYAASLPGVLTVLSGMSSMEQLRDNIATMSPFVPLRDEEYKVIDEAVRIYQVNATVPCTACRYCMDCPAGVDIPGVFSIYNHLQNDGRIAGFLMEYGWLGDAGAASCVDCKQCVERCPQLIDIPRWMTVIDEAYREKKAQP